MSMSELKRAMTRPAFIAELLEAARKARKAKKTWRNYFEEKDTNDSLWGEWVRVERMMQQTAAKATAYSYNILELASYIEELEAGRIAARNEALEEAARLADVIVPWRAPGKHGYENNTADKIRALKSKENEHGKGN